MTPAVPPLLFHGLRLRMARNAGRALWQTSAFRVLTILVSSLLMGGTVFAVALYGFGTLRNQNIPGSGVIVEILFDFLFLSLAVLLVFSGGIILYGSLFTSAETAFLLSTPARADRVFAYKFQGAVAFSSWAFVLLGFPILLAYGVIYHVAWPFYALLPLYFVGFLLLPGSLGAAACLIAVNLAPKQRQQLVIAAGLVVIVALGLWGYRTVQGLKMAREASSRDSLTMLLGQFEFASHDWMPSHWMTRGLQEAARGHWDGTLYPLALLWSNGLMLYLLVSAASVTLYRRGYNRLATGGNIRKRFGRSPLDRWADRLLGFLDTPTRLLIIKDFRTFRRDPSQWAQILIFAGLVLLYFSNSRQFFRSDLGRPFQHGIGLLNLSATAMLLCAYMGRFIYPMLSLEGRKFWILGLLPLRRDKLLWGKFAFAAVGSVGIAEVLILMSDLLLGLPWLGLLMHAVTVVVVALGLSGLSVGLGAIMPNFRESDPSKIAVGFGGTLNLIAGLLYLTVAIGVMVGPYHAVEVFGGLDRRAWLPYICGGGVLAGVVLGTACTVLPLRAGARALAKMEF